jgi:hypothetical protein
MRRQSTSPDPMRAAAGALAVLLGLAVPGAVGAQSGLDATCGAGLEARQAECRLAAATVRATQERIGIALWGGHPVPANASTVGMRLGSTPRISAAASLGLVPVHLPPLTDRTEAGGERSLLPAAAAHATVGVFQGWSPLPTVGGVLSLDLVGRLSVAALPGLEFQEGAAVGGQVGVRVGALRESFTMPGVSLTALYGRSNTLTYGDRTAGATDGFARGAISDFNTTLAASRRFAPFRLSAGLALDRYATAAHVGFPDGAGGMATERGSVVSNRQSVFGGAEWSTLIFHSSAELGWQGASEPEGLPSDVRFQPSRWWGKVAFRISI